jgi:2-oxoglutarate dehydrogenase complex dehydrogenase (E1) component-like enzyme
MAAREHCKNLKMTNKNQSIFYVKNRVFGVLIHGDAAVSGQGVVYESL